MTQALVTAITALGMALSATAVDAAMVSGRVVNMSAQAAPVAGVEVVLRSGVMGTGETADVSTTTNQDGKFEFRAIQGRPGLLFGLQATFAGVPQLSAPFHVSDDDITRTVAVHDTTSSPENVAVERLHLIVTPSEADVSVTAVYIVQNWSGIYVGDPPAGEGVPRLGLRINVPREAHDFQVREGVVAAHHKVTPDGIASTMPFHPGSDTLVVSYHVPFEDGEARWEISSPYPMSVLNVIAMAGAAELEVEGAESVPSPMGQQLINYERTMISAGETIEVTVLPAGASGVSAGRWLVIIAIVAMVGVVAFAFYVRRKQPTATGGSSPGGGTESSGTREPVDGDPRTPSALEEAAETGEGAADALVQQIAALDTQYENGDVDEEEYVSKRREMKRELIEALKQESA